ncbi:MAG: hypothetical protein ACE5JT_03770 [Nitrosopumilaceae archaeon]
MVNYGTPKKITISELFAKGSVIALIITIPSLSAFFLSWYLLDEVISAAIVGIIVHFIAMGFSVKISKKLHRKQEP